MIEVNNLNKQYKKLEAVKNVSFNVESGQITLLLGPNGAGKSTIIKSMVGLLPCKGSIMIDGYKSNSIEARKLFSYIPEIPYPFLYLTIREHIEFMYKAYDVELNEEELNFYLDAYDLKDKQNKLGKELSKGMSQKLSVVCGLVTNPKYVLLDEPLIGLDPKAIKMTKKIISDLKAKNVGILVSTHIIDTLDELWDNAIILKEGEVLLQDKREFFNSKYPNKSLEDIFFELTEKVQS